MKNRLVITLLCGMILCSSPFVYAQKHKPAAAKKQKTAAAAPSRGFSTALQFVDPKGEKVGQPLKFGVHLDATYCVDMKLGESFVPPIPPPGIADIRFMDPRDGGASCMDLGINNDFRPYLNSAQVDTYLVNVQPNANGTPLTVSWTNLNKYYGGPVVMSDQFEGKIFKTDMKKNTSAVIPSNIRAVVIIAEKPVNPLKVK